MNSPTNSPRVEAPGQPPSGGRPRADWWEDCLLDLAFQHFRENLSHKTQADIGRAMEDWIQEHGYSAAPSTIKLRAKKLFNKIQSDQAEK